MLFSHTNIEDKWDIVIVNLKIMEHSINYKTTATTAIQEINDYSIYNNDSLTTSG